MEKTINTRMSQKHDTEAHWKLAINFIPLKGELIIYDVDENNPNERIKIGNGVDFWKDLPMPMKAPTLLIMK